MHTRVSCLKCCLSLGAWCCLALGVAGCAQVSPLPEYVQTTHDLQAAARGSMKATTDGSMAAALGVPPAHPSFSGPQPVDVYIRAALEENRLVQAARSNVLALRYRIPQVTALDDPVVSSTYFPSAKNGLQTVDGFMPWSLLVAQQFPWFGTLSLRGLAAEQDVQVALAELCAAQLDVVEAVKRAYFDLAYNERAEQILLDNRALIEDFLDIARIRYETGQASQQDVLSAEVALNDLDRELLTTRQGITSAQAELAEQLHVHPEADLRTIPGTPVGDVPAQIDRLYALAVSARPELRGRLASVARDATAVELARKRYKPNVTLGFNYGLMTVAGSMLPDVEANDNLGLFLGFNVPIYHAKNDAAVREAQARTVADARLYEAERDATLRAIRDLLSQARTQRATLDLFEGGILPRAHDALEIASSEYEAGNVDFLTLLTAWREVLQIELQVALLESSLGQNLASLERAVGLQLNENPPAAVGAENSDPMSAPPPPETAGPFQGDEEGESGSPVEHAPDLDDN